MSIFDKFAQEIKFSKNEFFENVKITKANLNESNQIFHLHFQNNEIIPFEPMLEFISCINKNFKYKTDFQFTIVSPVYQEQNLFAYINWVIQYLLRNANLAKIFQASTRSLTFSGKLTITLNVPGIAKEFEQIKNDLVRIIRKFGFSNFDFDILCNGKGADLLTAAEQNNYLKAQTAFKNQANEQINKPEVYKKTLAGFEKVAIDKLAQMQSNYVEVEGVIFKIDQFVSKRGTTIFVFKITNNRDAVDVKVFTTKKEHIARYNNFQAGDWINVRGNLQIDSFSRSRVIIASTLRQIIKEEEAREDTSKEKRVELALRTRMSTMDGVASAQEYLKLANNWKHQAVAIIDTESVQSFPEFYNYAKKLNIKPIYGVTLNVLDRNHFAIYNPQKRTLLDDEYVVFDIETTGLSAHYHEIIEFGAVVIKNNQIIDYKQFFIKPKNAIPVEITRLTNITNADVANAQNEKEGLEAIVAFVQNRTLVAHNASFDINFINEKLAQNKMPTLENPLVDTLIVARILAPESRKFNLQAVAKFFNVTYDTIGAHRADYDADVLAKIWIKMIANLTILQIDNQQKLANYQAKHVYQKAFTYEISVLAKNQAGLKKLFQLVSSALTDNLFKGATVFWDQLKDPNLLIGSGALKSDLINKVFYSSRQVALAEMAKYDYIEVQPPQNFKHQLNTFTQAQIHDALSWMIRAGKKQNKIVVATGDVRYLNIEDKIFHEVYIHAKGLGGKPHYLKKFNINNPVYPDQHFLTTTEMKKQFSFLNDMDLIKEIVVTNSQKIANQIADNIVVIKDKLYTPLFSDAEEKLEKLVYQNAYQYYGDPLPQIVKERIKKEIEPIKKYGFAVIYWISHLLVAKSLSDGYLVGSRGSVGSSFVATMLQITEVNPLEPHYLCSNCKYSEFFTDSNLNSGFDLPFKKCPKCQKQLKADGQNIPFETFLGFNADKVPDIDLNFSGEYQAIIHQEVKNIFGENHSFRAGTISTVAEKTAFGFVKGWAEDTKRDLSRSFIEYLAKKVSGTKRTTGQHPGGIIVVPKNMDIEDFSPINFPANDKNSSWKTTHFDFHAIHDNVLKLDLLGHDDPTAIRYLEKLTGVDVKRDISFQDPQIIKLFSSTEPLKIDASDIDGEKTGAMGVPEFGTSFVRRMLQTAKVKSFGDLIAVSGLSHGTDVWTGNAEVLIKKQNKTLSDVISCRDNIMTDLMAKKMDHLLAFQIMESVRKGKGLTAEWEKILKEHQVEPWYIDSLQKIKYMFPKAHATAYVMMAWRIAWFKLYHPSAYYATYFTTRADVFDIKTILQGSKKVLEKLRYLKEHKNVRGEHALSNKDIALIPIFEMALEAFARHIEISNIDINKSEAKDWVIDKNTLIPPFVSLDGLGEAAAISVVEARKNGPFHSIEDLQKRTSLNKTVIALLKEINVLEGWNETNQLQFDLFSL